MSRVSSTVTGIPSPKACRNSPRLRPYNNPASGAWAVAVNRAMRFLPGLEAAFLQVLQEHTAGSPMRATGKWTNLTHQEIADRLAVDHGITVSVTVVKRLLQHHDFVRRKAQKRTRTGECTHRDAQFTKITRLKEDYTACGQPVVSIDTKKKS